MSVHKPLWLKRSMNAGLLLLGLTFLTYLVIRAMRGGNDINVYLHAASQILNHENIYIQNPYNFYLYSPLFALALAPLTFVKMALARVMWMLFNLILAIRIWYLLKGMSSDLSHQKRKIWAFLVIVLSLGFLNHNFVLGQVTILILWLTLEGIWQVAKGNTVMGALLIGLGINIKIIPMFAIAYLGLKGHFRAILYVLLFFGISLILPATILGFKYNSDLLTEWQYAINPSGEKFVFEDNDGCHSLNALLPAYFYDFHAADPTSEPKQPKIRRARMIYAVPHDILVGILQTTRLLVILFFIVFVLPRSWLYGRLSKVHLRLWQALKIDFASKVKSGASISKYLFRDVALLCLITLLIFPHQMKYSMLYFVPAGAYVMYFYLRWSEIRGRVTFSSAQKNRYYFVGVVGATVIVVLTVMGREIIGSHLVNILDYYHFMGFSNIIFLGILWFCNPAKIQDHSANDQLPTQNDDIDIATDAV